MCQHAGDGHGSNDRSHDSHDGHGDGSSRDAPPRQPRPDDGLPFPWHLGALDAHCHPTDTMAAVAAIPDMKARVLAIMATRAQDQNLVADVASSYYLHARADFENTMSTMTAATSSTNTVHQHHRHNHCKVVPSFGWHPWFSHQIFDDSVPNPTYTQPSFLAESVSDAPVSFESRLAAKTAHYSAVLSPSPEPSFVASLPGPIPLSSFISATRNRLLAHPLALVGEIGLDRAFRLPQPWEPSTDTTSLPPPPQQSQAPAPRDSPLTPGGREGRPLSPYRVAPAHQRALLEAQLHLAGELERPVSVHGVQAHGALYDAVSSTWKGWEKEVVSRRQKRLAAPGAEDNHSSEPESESESDNNNDSNNDDNRDKTDPSANEANDNLPSPGNPGKPFPPRICLHSFSGGAQLLRQWLHPSVPATIFFSFSTAVNASTGAARGRLTDVLAAIPDDRLLVESDLHTAGPDMDAALEDMYREVCAEKGWGLEDGVRRIAQNYEHFIFGPANKGKK